MKFVIVILTQCRKLKTLWIILIYCDKSMIQWASSMEQTKFYSKIQSLIECITITRYHQAHTALTHRQRYIKHPSGESILYSNKRMCKPNLINSRAILDLRNVFLFSFFLNKINFILKIFFLWFCTSNNNDGDLMVVRPRIVRPDVTPNNARIAAACKQLWMR